MKNIYSFNTAKHNDYKYFIEAESMEDAAIKATEHLDKIYPEPESPVYREIVSIIQVARDIIKAKKHER